MFSNQEIDSVIARGSQYIEEWICLQANQHKIIPSSPDTFTQAVTRLMGIELDPVERLLLALSEANVITVQQRSLLQIRYLHGKNS